VLHALPTLLTAFMSNLVLLPTVTQTAGSEKVQKFYLLHSSKKCSILDYPRAIPLFLPLLLPLIIPLFISILLPVFEYTKREMQEGEKTTKREKKYEEGDARGRKKSELN